MGIHRTLWSPDTCDCSIEYEWNDSVPSERMVHTVYKVHKVCEAHQHKSILDRHDHYKTILEENQRKNVILAQFMDDFPEHTEEVEPEIGGGTIQEVDNITKLSKLSTETTKPTKRLKSNIKFLYGWTGEGKNRVLHVKFHGADLSDNKKKSFTDSTYKKLGHKKVNVV
jgi:hypothetical protein